MTEDELFKKLKSFNKDKFIIKNYNFELLQRLTQLELERKIKFTLKNSDVEIEILEEKKTLSQSELNHIAKEIRKRRVEEEKPKYSVFEGVKTLVPKEKFYQVIEMYKNNVIFDDMEKATGLPKTTIKALVERWRKTNGIKSRKELAV